MNGPKTLIEFMEMYNTEEDCQRALYNHKWPDGFRCPRCGHDNAYAHRKRQLFECKACGHQTSLTADTVLHKTRVDLKKWFLAIFLLSQTKKTISAAELSRQLGIAPQTAWTMRRKITEAMARREGELMITGTCEMDESFMGGTRKGIRGRGAKGKTPVAVMAGVNESGALGMVHMQAIGRVGSLSLEGAAQEAVTPGTDIITDGLHAYRGLASLDYGHRHQVLESPEDAVAVLPWMHVTISNFKRWVLDIFHGVSPKHLQSYLDEFCYRLNRRRSRTDLFRRLLNRCVLYTGPVTYAQLVVS